MHINRMQRPMDNVNFIAKLADLKESNYQHNLMIGAIIEILIEKGALTAQEVAARVERLDQEAMMSPYADMRLPEQ